MSAKDAGAVQLEPSRPPGRSSRKARSFLHEIHRLLDEGYSLDGIRVALAEAGVCVSKSTVHREAVRRRSARTVVTPPRPLRTEPLAPPPAPRDARSSRDIAREFVDGRITNPLLLAKGHR